MSDHQFELIKSIPTLNLCYIRCPIIAIGHTASIYRCKNKVVKEIYLEETLEKSRSLNELILNHVISQNKELSKYSIPFYGYDICEKRKSIMLEFEFVGQSLYDQLPSLTLKDLKFIVKELKRVITLFNDQGIVHYDLHNRNIFLSRNKDNKITGVLLGDWGNGQMNTGKRDSLNKHFYIYLYQDLILSYYLKHNSLDDAVEYLKSKNKYKLLMNLFNWDKKYLLEKYSYRPAKFLEQVSQIIFVYKVKFLLSNEPEIVKESKVPKEILEYVKELNIDLKK